jgi:3-hydroxybutyrate dehydrogenase
MLAGKVALVTGGTSGIGFGVAAGLARQGARVFANDLNPPPQAPAGQTYLKADISDRSQVRAMIDSIGQVDILVNSAGIQHIRPLVSFE